VTLVTEFRRMFEYEQDAHRKMLDSLRAAAGEHGDEPAFRQAINLAEHLAAARLIWLGRFGRFEGAPTTWFPNTATTVQELDVPFNRMHAAWAGYLARLDDEELGRQFVYKSLTDEGRFTDVVRDILFQLFGHSFYHRGQIALLLRKIGAEPALTDLVYWTRRPASRELPVTSSQFKV